MLSQMKNYYSHIDDITEPLEYVKERNTKENFEYSTITAKVNEALIQGQTENFK